MKKLFMLLFAFSATFWLVACGNGGDDGIADAGDVLDLDELPAEIQALIQEWDLPAPRFTPDPNVPSWQKDYDHFVELVWYNNHIWWPEHQLGDSFVTRVMRDDMNIHIHFISGNDDNLNTMIAAGELPDIITIWGGMPMSRQAYEFALPLDVLSQVYDPYFLEHVAHPQIVNWFTLEDGHFYGMPNDAMTADAIEAGYAWNNAGFLVRKDIFEAIGSPDMSTPNGFLNALRAAREHTPYADHGVPLVAFAGHAMDISAGQDGAFGGFLQDSLAIPIEDAQGNWYDRDAHPEYLEWLLVLRQAMEEGLMNTDQFSDDGELIQDRFAMGTFFAYMTPNTFDVASRLQQIEEREPGQMMVPISGPRNQAGADHTFTAGSLQGWTHTFITQNTSDPQAAMQVITYLASNRGTELVLFGVEGETFDWVDGIPVLHPELDEFRNTDYYGFRDEYGIGTFWMLRNLMWANKYGNLPAGLQARNVEFAQQFNHARLHHVNLEPVDGALMRNLENINVARSQAIAAVLQAPNEAAGRQIWEEFLASRENFDFEGITEYRNARLQENRARLGMN